MAMRNAIVYVGELGAETYTQSLNGILYTEDQIGFMADRILWTQEQIGEMANRIVYVIELSQFNTILAMYMITDISFLGIDNFMNNMFQYAVTVNPANYIPWLTRSETVSKRQRGCPYQPYRNVQCPFMFTHTLSEE